MENKGFTLIELLIVIVILGILAVAVLSAINPLEQMRKARDSAKKSDSAELLNSLERYYTTFGCYPWARSTGSCSTSYTPPSAQPVSQSGTPQTWLSGSTTSLVAMNELKPEFTRRKNLDSLYVTESTAANTKGLVHVCFLPESKTYQAQAAFTQTGDDAGTVGAAGNYICVPE